jgi:hypothetical protein
LCGSGRPAREVHACDPRPAREAAGRIRQRPDGSQTPGYGPIAGAGAVDGTLSSKPHRDGACWGQVCTEATLRIRTTQQHRPSRDATSLRLAPLLSTGSRLTSRASRRPGAAASASPLTTPGSPGRRVQVGSTALPVAAGLAAPARGQRPSAPSSALSKRPWPATALASKTVLAQASANSPLVWLWLGIGLLSTPGPPGRGYLGLRLDPRRAS